MSRRGASELAILKEAEDQAAEIVAKAREERKALMRAATAEAAREVAEFKAMREAQLRRESPEAEALRRRSDAVKAATEAKLVALEAEYARNKDLVTGMLLQVVLSIDNPYARK